PILEVLGDYASRIKDHILLTEYVRHRLARSICTRYRDKQRCLHVVTLDPALEDRIRAGFDHNEQGLHIRLSPQAVEAFCRMISAELEKLVTAGHAPVLLASPQIRAAVKQMTAPHIPQLVVLSYNEITRDTKIESVAMLTEGQ
ncbi:MAG: FHIPEP family type III secretion protein, partial [Thermoguttaceae bacterium]